MSNPDQPAETPETLPTPGTEIQPTAVQPEAAEPSHASSMSDLQMQKMVSPMAKSAANRKIKWVVGGLIFGVLILGLVVFVLIRPFMAHAQTRRELANRIESIGITATLEKERCNTINVGEFGDFSRYNSTCYYTYSGSCSAVVAAAESAGYKDVTENKDVARKLYGDSYVKKFDKGGQVVKVAPNMQAPNTCEVWDSKI